MPNAMPMQAPVNATPYRPVDRLAALGERLARTVSVARALTVARREVELAGLEDGVGMLCAQTLDLLPDEARAMVPVLTELLAQLDALSLAIHAAAGAPPA